MSYSDSFAVKEDKSEHFDALIQADSIMLFANIHERRPSEPWYCLQLSKLSLQTEMSVMA